MAMLMRQVFAQSWDNVVRPHATAIAIPSSYDQLHRRSIMQAAQMAGFSSVRLVDRSVAAVHSLRLGQGPLDPDDNPNKDSDHGANDETMVESLLDDQDDTSKQNILFVGVTGQATDVAIIRGDASRLQQICTTGHWHGGTLPWLNRLVALANDAFKRQHSFDPKSKLSTATALQIACEDAMNSMLLIPNAKIEITIAGKPRSITVDRQEWLSQCSDLLASTRSYIQRACEDSKVAMHRIDRCVTLGAVLRMQDVRDPMLDGLPDHAIITPIDRGDVARGAAACLAAELPGRGQLALPPRGVTSQTIGLVVEDTKSRRRILPIIPRGTSIPARTNRRLSANDSRKSMTVSLVESSGLDGGDWHSLGRHEFDIESANGTKRSRTISFELNANGLLNVLEPKPVGNQAIANASKPSSNTKLPPLPKPNLTEEELASWKSWIESVC